MQSYSDITGGMSASSSNGVYAGSVTKGDLAKLTSNLSDDDALRAASEEFSSVFIGQLTQVMRSTVDKTNLMDGGQGEEIFQGLLDQEYSREIAQTGRYGITDMVYNSLKSKSAAQAYSGGE